MGKSPLPRTVGFLAFFMVAAAQAATFTVTNGNDNLAGSLRQAIQDAAPGDTIVFNIPKTDSGYKPSTDVNEVGLTSAELVISKDLTIDGAGSKIEVIRRGPAVFRIFNVVSGNVTLANLTVSFGAVVNGAGVNNTGNLTLRNCTFHKNGAGIGGQPPRGGAINNEGTAELTNCTLFDNNADRGAGIYNAGNISVRNSTIFRNGPGATGETPGFEHAAGTARVRSSVIAFNSGSLSGSAANVLGAFTSEGYNFISNADGSTGFGNSGSRDQVGTRAAPADPRLPNAAGDYGGPARVLRPLPGSPLIDQGDSGGIGSDQRGVARPMDQPTIANAGDGADIGAVEIGSPQGGPAFTVTTTANRRDPGESPCSTDDCTLAEALDRANANSDPNTISFSPVLAGHIAAPLGAFEIYAPLTIRGPGARKLALSGEFVRRVLVTAGPGIVISGLTISGGRAEAPVAFGAGIYNAGSLTLTECAIQANIATGGGAGIFNTGDGRLILDACTLAGNHAIGEGEGGALYNFGSVNAVNSTFSDNSAFRGGAITSNGGGTLALVNCTIFGNSGRVGGIDNSAGSAAVVNTIIAGNTGSVANDVSGTFTSEGHNLIGRRDGSVGFTNGVNGDQVGTNAAPIDPLVEVLRNNGGPTDTRALRPGSPAINAGNDNRAPRVDQRGYSRVGVSDIGAVELGGLPTGFANISTRLQVGRDDNVLIGGFIITGTQPKKLMVRAIGPSTGVAGALADPQLEIFNSSGQSVAFNDNWQDAPNRSEVQDSTIAPTNNAESAVLRTLNPGAYTAVVSGAGGGTGVGLVEVYDLDRASDSKLANIATRGFVQTGDDVMIGGFIIVGGREQRLLVRAIGPSLSIAGKLADPLLEIYNNDGALLASNDNWRSTQEADIAATGIPPSNDFEAAIVGAVPAGAYTAIVRGAGDTTGVAVVEVYALE